MKNNKQLKRAALFYIAGNLIAAAILTILSVLYNVHSLVLLSILLIVVIGLDFTTYMIFDKRAVDIFMLILKKGKKSFSR